MNCSTCSRCGECRRCSSGCNDSCFPDGSKSIPFGSEPGAVVKLGECCLGCGARQGGTHHLACHVELCPRCLQSALLLCECWLGGPEMPFDPAVEFDRMLEFFGDPTRLPRA